jgi:hypothetical protein
MLVLRWLIGVGCAVALALFLLILVVGKGLRSAYQSGAGTLDVVRDTAVAGIPLLLIAMLVSVFLPNSRAYLHVVAAGVLLAMAGCAMMVPESPGEGLLYLSFFGLWGIYYLLAVWVRQV